MIRRSLYKQPLTLLTDFYQLTMLYGYWKQGMHDRRASFYLHYRKPPFGGQFVLSAGLQSVIEYLDDLRFSVSDIQYLARLKGADGRALFGEPFLNFLQRMRFSCNVDAIPEGQVVYPFSPMLRVEGPLWQAQLIETYLLNRINFETLIATKAARIVTAADGDDVIDFGLRRAQGPDGGVSASRAAYLGGCAGTSNVLAGKLYGIPLKGTHAHSWIMSFEDEQAAMNAYAQTLPSHSILLVDTLDTLEGVQKAIKTAALLRKNGHDLIGIRLDSGDLVELSRKARAMLDEAGYENTQIVASNDLDEHKIRELKARGARIDSWGVGTRLVTAYDQPALGGVYKLSAIQDEDGDWQPRIKRSNDPIKNTLPGRLHLARHRGNSQLDVVYDPTLLTDPEHLQLNGNSYSIMDFNPLMKPIYRSGKRVYNPPAVKEIRAEAMSAWKSFAIRSDHQVQIEDSLKQLSASLLRS